MHILAFPRFETISASSTPRYIWAGRSRRSRTGALHRFVRSVGIWLADRADARARAAVLALPDDTLIDVGLTRDEIVASFERKRIVRRLAP